MYISITKSSIHPSQLLDHQTQVSEQATILFHICSSCDRSPPDSADTERSTGIVAAQSVEFSVSGHIARLQWCGVFGRRYEGGWSLQVIFHALFLTHIIFPFPLSSPASTPAPIPPYLPQLSTPDHTNTNYQSQPFFANHQIRKQTSLEPSRNQTLKKPPTTYSQTLRKTKR